MFWTLSSWCLWRIRQIPDKGPKPSSTILLYNQETVSLLTGRDTPELRSVTFSIFLSETRVKMSLTKRQGRFWGWECVGGRKSTVERMHCCTLCDSWYRFNLQTVIKILTCSVLHPKGSHPLSSFLASLIASNLLALYSTLLPEGGRMRNPGEKWPFPGALHYISSQA